LNQSIEYYSVKHCVIYF